MRGKSWRYLGRAVECPICDRRYREFAPALWDGRRWHGDRVRCASCGSLPRHRLLWLYLRERDLLEPPVRLLHLAPEPAIADRLAGRSGIEYVSADLEAGRAAVQADITALAFPDESFDVVLCSHVLEHVDDDRAGMREVLRVLRPGGVAAIQTPVNHDQAETYEDAAEADPAERLRRFSQRDHLRVYGRDLSERLRGAGFEVAVVSSSDFDADARRRHGLDVAAGPLRNDLYECRRPTGA